MSYLYICGNCGKEKNLETSWRGIPCSNCGRTMKNNGRVVWNIPSFSNRQNLYQFFGRLFEQTGFKQYAEIIWDKKQISSRTAWGSFASASEPNILPRHEYILVYYKLEKNKGKGEDTISKTSFIKWTDGMWEFTPETRSNHPAPFPKELPSRCIEMFSYKNDLIFDPFMGSGTTARACIDLKRRFIGAELSEEYCQMWENKLKQQTLL